MGSLRAVTYYRLRMLDLDGTFAYSRVVSLNSDQVRALIAYPNPVKQAVTVEPDKSYLGSQASLSTASGVRLRQILINQRQLPINMSSYNPGLYLLHMADGRVVKLVKE
ncbi:T9SS type A sorting domain-containing protein [Dyadobacter psychrotolerans]|uniref:T9SS type A sorting domain-containing protein n=1 Tax=Dyadobacter psychrotolerans TaxID=2541721 RepID=A0A4R5DAZ1_9BACT|nr:T9SS type A sorting domain-containing protein [Dyadobacter psychrotolerans]TDE10846.1 T9SS type A sorting domain-containing protein [Dyadobacter psychrotolerans]